VGIVSAGEQRVYAGTGRLMPRVENGKIVPQGGIDLTGSGVALPASVASGSALGATAIQPSAYGVVPDVVNLGPFNLVNSGAVGTVGSASNTGQDHTALVQAFVNAVSVIANTLNPAAAAVIDCPCLHYRVQNVDLPGNVELRANGTRFTYVSSSSLNPPTGPGNYVFRVHSAYNGITGKGVISGNGASQPGIGGVWTQSAGQAAIGSARSYQCIIGKGIFFQQFAGRAVFDQGVANDIQKIIVQNSLLGATNIDHFMGAVEQAGTDGQVSVSEITPSVVETSNGIAMPRCPTIYDTGSITTTNGEITLPLSNGTITLVSTTNASIHGGLLSIGGHLITYRGVSGATLTGCYCADSGKIATATSIYAMTGFVSALHIAGGTNWSWATVAEFGDVPLTMGPSVLAHSVGSVELTTAGVGKKPVVVDNAIHFGNIGLNGTAGGELAIWSASGTVITMNRFFYTSISEGTLEGVANLSTVGKTLQISSTTGWPASGSFDAHGYMVNYTSIVDGTHLGGCTIAAGTATLPSGTYIRSNTLNECYVASGTLTVGNNRAMISIGANGQRAKTWGVRSDFSRTHGVVSVTGSGQHSGVHCINGAQVADNAYDGWHVVAAGTASAFVDATKHWADNGSTTNRWRYGIFDAGQASEPCHWESPRQFNCVSPYNISIGWTNLVPDTGTILAVNSATPSVANHEVAVCENTSATTITNIGGGVPGQDLCLFQDSKTTIENNANIVTKTKENIPPAESGHLVPLHFKKLRVPTVAWYQV
jgi:hypothetical protein